MSEFLTIQAFSERTGISKSALRYYEAKKLLRSVGRSASGYRFYSDEQIPLVKLISSLRIADVPIKDIRLYLEEKDTIKQRLMMEKWIEMIKKRQQILSVSLRFLESDNSDSQVYLLEKDREKIVWFSAESEVGNFGDYVMKWKKDLKNINIHSKSCYLKYVSGTDLIKVQIGFEIPLDTHINKLIEYEKVEYMAPCICIAISFSEPITKIQEGYQQLIAYANENKWIPTGPILEWYRGDSLRDLDLILPVTQIGNRKDL